jgi:hypothetical protein
MGSSLAHLKALSKDDRLRRLVRTLVIQDDCEKLDPYMIGDFPQVDSLTCVWPRDYTGDTNSPGVLPGIVTAGELDAGIADLAHLLRERLLQPKTVHVRDYHITQDKFLLGAEMARVKEMIQVTPRTAEHAVSVRVGGLAEIIVEHSNVAVTSLEIRSVDIGFFPPVSWDPLVSKLGWSVHLACPRAEEATIELSENYDGKETTFSMLRSTDILVENDSATYWLEQIFYKSPNLETLSLNFRKSLCPQLAPDRVVPKLSKFSMSHIQTTISAQDIHAMLASSKESLTHLDLCSINLTGGSWRSVLSLLAAEYHSLTSFKLDFLREEKGVVSGEEKPCFYTLDFGDARDHVPEAYLQSLNLIEKPRCPHRPVGTVTYDGPNAGPVLEVLASKGKPGDFRRPKPSGHLVT